MGDDGSLGASGPDDGTQSSQGAQAHDAAATPTASISVVMLTSSAGEAGQVAVAQEEPAAAANSGDSGNSPGQKKNGAAAKGSSSNAPVEVPEELRAAIVRQVEFYFGDANLPTDDFLMKLVKKNAEGWVPIRAIADFHKMKKLSRSFPAIVAALRTSTELEISPNCKLLRRIAPLPELDLDDTRARTVIAWNLPDKPKIEQVIETFSAAGAVSMARIRTQDHPEPLLTKGLKTAVKRCGRPSYALVEYATVEEADRAVKLLNDESNWRSGLKVLPLLQRPPPQPFAGGDGSAAGGGARGGAAAAAAKEKKQGRVSGRAAAAGTAENSGVRGDGVASPPPAERPVPSWAQQKRKSKGEYAAWASAAAAGAAGKGGEKGGAGGESGGGEGGAGDGKGAGEQANINAAGGGGDIPGKPRMPDGTRGFGMGRGKPPVLSPGNKPQQSPGAGAALDT